MELTHDKNIYVLYIVIMLYNVSYAQSDPERVRAVVAAYHDALGALDGPRMKALWARSNDVMLINPMDKEISVGWNAVERDWDAQFQALTELRISQLDGPHVQCNGDTAWSTGIVTNTFKLKSGFEATAQTFETDVLQKIGGQWMLVSHTALDMSPHAH